MAQDPSWAFTLYGVGAYKIGWHAATQAIAAGGNKPAHAATHAAYAIGPADAVSRDEIAFRATEATAMVRTDLTIVFDSGICAYAASKHSWILIIPPSK